MEMPADLIERLSPRINALVTDALQSGEAMAALHVASVKLQALQAASQADPENALEGLIESANQMARVWLQSFQASKGRN